MLIDVARLNCITHMNSKASRKGYVFFVNEGKMKTSLNQRM